MADTPDLIARLRRGVRRLDKKPADNNASERALANEAATALEAAQARIAELENAIQAFADFDAMPVAAKRPDVFEIRVRQPLFRALKGADNG